MPDNSITCWFCQKEQTPGGIESVETNSQWAAYGYCYCRPCITELRKGFEVVQQDIESLADKGLSREEAINLTCFGAD